jgi:mono/diheme cytochrome c family protein
MIKAILRGLGILVGVLVLLIVIVIAVAYIDTNSRMSKTYNLPANALSIDMSKANVARGQHLVVSLGACADCHGENLAGKTVLEDPALGNFYGRNLTSGAGGTSDFADEDWVRALRYGLGQDGRSLLIMPSGGFNSLHDEDLASMIAYLKSLPAVDHEQPEISVGPLGRLLTLAGMFPLFSAEPIDISAARPEPVPARADPAYGHYLVKVGGCSDCHGANLAGGSVPGMDASVPHASNLTPGGELVGWTVEDFKKAIREGITPSGRTLSTSMPWQQYGNMNDEELEAIWLYLQSLEARELDQN